MPAKRTRNVINQATGSDILGAPFALREIVLHAFLSSRANVLARANYIDEVCGLEKQALNLDVQAGLAIIPVCGALGMGLAEWEKRWCGMCDIDDVSDLFDEAMTRDDVRGVLFLGDSPGGSIMGISELAARIRAGRAEKPSAWFSRSMTASAAQWLAAQCTACYGTPSSIWGSIGIYTVMYDESGWFSQNGIKVHVVKSGENKAIGIPGTKITEEQVAQVQKRVDAAMAMFRSDITAGRGSISDDSMDGSDWFAPEAQTRGLLDEILPTAEAAAAELLKLI